MKACRHRGTIFFFLIALWAGSFSARAQCAMCRAVLESSRDAPQAEGINNGIVYLMAIPYVLVAVIGFFLYRNYRNRNSD